MSYQFFGIARLSSHVKGSIGLRYPRIERSAITAIDKRSRNGKVLQVRQYLEFRRYIYKSD